MAGVGLAMFAPVVNDLQVELVPAFFGEVSLQVFLGLGDAFAVRQFPSLGQAVNMGVDRKSRVPKGLSHDNRCGFVSDSREFFQFIEGRGHFPLMLAEQNFGQSLNRLRLARSQTARSDDLVDGFHGLPGHVKRVVGQGEEFRSDLVYPCVCALGGQKNRDQKGERILVFKGNGRGWIQFVQFTIDQVQPFTQFHLFKLANIRSTFNPQIVTLRLT